MIQIAAAAAAAGIEFGWSIAIYDATDIQMYMHVTSTSDVHL